jgi:hypothetical protein
LRAYASTNFGSYFPLLFHEGLNDREKEAKPIRSTVAAHHEFAGAKRTAEEAANYLDEDESGGITGTVTLGGFLLMALAFVGLGKNTHGPSVNTTQTE